MIRKLNVLIISALILFIPQKILKGHYLFISENKSVAVDSKNIVVNKDLDSIYSSKKLGSFIINDKTFFRLFAPNAVKVELHTFKNADDHNNVIFKMERDTDGVWEAELDGELNGIFYGYKVYNNIQNGNGNSPHLVVDPYAKAVTTLTTYMSPRKAIVFEDNYDWGNDTWIQRDWRDLIIYEMHVRDMTSHPSSGSNYPGTYKGLVEPEVTGGINYLKKLGINTVELMPTQEFANIEIPFEDSLDGNLNTWNPYERNHWGYMTSNFFAPAAYYSENWREMKWNTWMGKEGEQVKQFKDMVKGFHKDGIGVIMDVVYNHLSEYEIGNLKQIDKEYYFRLDKKGNYIAESFCGNDLKTERPMFRRLIIESILYWMKEYHVDGFRFDLGKLLDWETIEEIISEARNINPNVVIVCEPWGGGYDPQGFSLREWGSWNDQIRNGIKGENPKNGLGWIFGKWYANNNYDRIKSYVRGTLVNETYGLFQKPEHSVNYLESHDGYTLGDFIRIAIKKINEDQIVSDIDSHIKLTETELKLNKLAALFLFTSKGITMIHSGQEYARSKVIASDNNIADSHKGMIDHNSYNKDNATNYINYNHAEINKELFNYYQELINFRKSTPAFRLAEYDSYNFYSDPNNKFSLAYNISYKTDSYYAVFNADQLKSANYDLPDGDWEIVVGDSVTNLERNKIFTGKISLPSVSGVILKKK